MTNLISIASNKDVRATSDSLARLIEAHDLKVFARIDHSSNAAAVGMDLRPTELLIFGNPKGGTPLMQDRQTTGLDLPFKVLVWEDEDTNVWLTYSDPNELIARHDLRAPSSATIDAISEGVTKLVRAAAQ